MSETPLTYGWWRPNRGARRKWRLVVGRETRNGVAGILYRSETVLGGTPLRDGHPRPAPAPKWARLDLHLDRYVPIR